MAPKKPASVKDATQVLADALKQQPEVSAEIARFKDFGAGIAMADLQPLSFALGGQTFHCRPAMSAKKVLELVKAGDAGEAAAGDAINGFIASALLPGEHERWEALMDDDDHIITPDILGDIVIWLIEQYSARPTVQ